MPSFDIATILALGIIIIMFYQIVLSDRQNKRYTEAINKNAEAIENNTKAINSVREIMVHISSSDTLHERLLGSIIDRLDNK